MSFQEATKGPFQARSSVTKKRPKHHVTPTALVSPHQLHPSVAPSNTSRPPPASPDPLPLNKQLPGRCASHWRCGSHRHGATLWLPRPGSAGNAINSPSCTH